MDIQEPDIKPYEILTIRDRHFTPDHVCIVTGAAGEIGRATAIAAAKNHLVVVGLDTDEQQGAVTRDLVKQHGGDMTFIPTDLCDDDSCSRAVAAAAGLGRIKFLANTAGCQHMDAIEDFPMETYDHMLHLMLRVPFLLSKLVIPHMKRSQDGTGVIANMSSIHGHICTRNMAAFNISKFGLRGLSQSISAEGGGKIRSFTVSTGFVRTRLALNKMRSRARQDHTARDEIVENIMMGHSRIKEMMTPIEVANMIIFGFSCHANYLIGGDLLFDGGSVLTY